MRRLLEVLDDVGAEVGLRGPVADSLGGLLLDHLLHGDLLGRGDVLGAGQAQALHPVEDDVAPGLRLLGVEHRVVGGRLLDDAGEQGGLAQVELRRADTEVVERGRLDAVGLVAVVDEVEVALEDLVLGEVLLDVQRVLQLLELARVGLVDGGLRGVLVAPLQRVLLEGDLHELLGERRGALHVAALQVGDQRPAEAADVEAAVLVEARVLDRDLRVLHVLVDLLQRHDDAVLVVRVGDQLPVGIEDAGLLGQRRHGELARQVVEEADPALGRLARGADRRDREPSHQQPGHRAEHDEAKQEPEHG